MSKKAFELAQNEQLAEQALLRGQLVQRSALCDSLQSALTFEQGSTHALLLTQDRLQDRLDILQTQIDQQGQNASSTQQALTANLRQKGEDVTERHGRSDAISALFAARSARLGTIAQELSDSLQAVAAEQWSTRQRNGQLYLTLSEDLLFRAGSTSRITNEGEALLRRTAQIILRYPEMEVRVVGHTDNQPVARQSLDNWQYSALRAVSVTKFLMEENIGANRMLAASKSEFQPLESNETKESRARNRRVELVIYPAAANFERALRGQLE